MFKLILDGEVVETVMYDSFLDTLKYATDKYGDNIKIQRIDRNGIN